MTHKPPFLILHLKEIDMIEAKFEAMSLKAESRVSDRRQRRAVSFGVDDFEDGVGVLDDRRLGRLQPGPLPLAAFLLLFHQLLLNVPSQVAAIQKQVELFGLEH